MPPEQEYIAEVRVNGVPMSVAQFNQSLGNSWVHSASVKGRGNPKAQKSDGSGRYGPKCNCHGERNMEHMGYCLYRCQQSGITYHFYVDAKSSQGYTVVPLPEVK